MGEYQTQFRSDRSTADQVYQIMEKTWEYNTDFNKIFIDFKQAYNMRN